MSRTGEFHISSEGRSKYQDQISNFILSRLVVGKLVHMYNDLEKHWKWYLARFGFVCSKIFFMKSFSHIRLCNGSAKRLWVLGLGRASDWTLLCSQILSSLGGEADLTNAQKEQTNKWTRSWLSRAVLFNAINVIQGGSEMMMIWL